MTRIESSRPVSIGQAFTLISIRGKSQTWWTTKILNYSPHELKSCQKMIEFKNPLSWEAIQFLWAKNNHTPCIALECSFESLTIHIKREREV